MGEQYTTHRWRDCRQLNQASLTRSHPRNPQGKREGQEGGAECWGLCPAQVQGQPGLSACSQAGGAQPPLSGGLQAGQGSIPSTGSHLRSARGGDVLPEGGYISRVPRSLQGLGGVLWNGIDLPQTPRHPLLPADHGLPERMPTRVLRCAEPGMGRQGRAPCPPVAPFPWLLCLPGLLGNRPPASSSLSSWSFPCSWCFGGSLVVRVRTQPVLRSTELETF